MKTSDALAPPASLRRIALRFVLLLGAVSLFADATYEGARSITGPFLATLGASAAVVGVVAGAGELLGYGVRLLSGLLADRLRRYWPLTLAGYTLNLIAVPLLALAGRWDVAALLIVAERIGKAIRTPPRDAMLSHATTQVGSGFGFGVHEALDQIGAVGGPLLVAAVLGTGATYRHAFAALVLPAVVSLSLLLVARRTYPEPSALEPLSQRVSAAGLPQSLRWYLVGIGLVAAGYADFSLLAYHFARTQVVSAEAVPLLYALAMASDAGAAILFGRWFDRVGLRALVSATLLAAGFAPLAFLGGSPAVVLATVLWGVGIGVQESILRAAVAEMVSRDRRASAFGIFNAVFGVCWFAGSATMGILYGLNPVLLVAFSLLAQLAAVPFFVAAGGRLSRTGPGHHP
jgi:MFS family permease